MKIIESSHDFRDDLIERLKRTGVTAKSFDYSCFERTKVVREKAVFSSQNLNRQRLIEIHFATKKLRPDGVWQSSFFLNRVDDSCEFCFVRRERKTELNIKIREYPDANSLQTLANENIPFAVRDVKISCFTLSKAGATDIAHVAKEVMEIVPESWFKRSSHLERKLIPFLEYHFILMGYVVFEPRIKAKTNFNISGSADLVGISMPHSTE